MRDLIRANAGLLFAGLATFVLMGAGQSLYGPALPAFARDMGLTVAQAGWLISAHWVGCFVGVGGMFVIGPKVSPRVVLAAMGLGAAGIALGLGWIGTLIAALVFGMGYGCATVVFNPRVLRAFGARGPAMLSALNASFGIGAIIAPLVFVALSSEPKISFALVAGLCALVWLGSGAAGKGEATTQAQSAQPFRVSWPILGFGLVAVGMEACLIGLGPTALITAGETEVRAAELLSMFFVAFLGVRVALIFTAHLLEPFSLYTLALGGAGVFSACAVVFDPGVFFVLTGLCAGAFFPGFYVTASRKMGENPRVAPTIIAAGLVGGIFSPVLLAGLLDGAGARGFFWVVASVMLAGTAVAVLCLRAMNRPGV